jgi:acyl-CoA thioesterase
VTALADILASAEPVEGGFRVTVPPDWAQGRTTYGGFSSALALHAAMGIEPDLPPLRSAQIAFIGPLAGEVTVTATKLRRGRNAAFIQADLTSEAGLGFRATFVFMAALPSELAHDIAPRATQPPPGPDAKLFTASDPTFFLSNLELLDLGAKGPAEYLRWVRLKERKGLHPMTELLAVGDALAPGAFKLFDKRQVPMSSLNWTINLLTAEPATTDGWWLLHTAADTARAGYSSQRMAIWNAAGEPVAEAMQAVAVFA